MRTCEVAIGGLTFKNPVLAASGTFGFGEEYAPFFDPGLLGGICTKGLTLRPREGNDGPRMWETPSGMLNSVGLQNPGIDAFIRDILPGMRRYGTHIIANVGGSDEEDYAAALAKLDATDVSIIELNISCPNVKHGGMALGVKTPIAEAFVRRMRRVTGKHLCVKLSPNAEDIAGMAEAVAAAGADSVSLINTVQGMAIDVSARKAVFENVYAGLSGPAVRPIALRMVHQVVRRVDIPVIGIGGIATADDALQFIMAGASAIQVGTANFSNPLAAVQIIRGIEEYMARNGIRSLDEIRGLV